MFSTCGAEPWRTNRPRFIKSGEAQAVAKIVGIVLGKRGCGLMESCGQRGNTFVRVLAAEPGYSYHTVPMSIHDPCMNDLGLKRKARRTLNPKFLSTLKALL